MFLIFLGPPGVGKGTQCKRVVEMYGLPHVSTGDIMRAAIQDQTALGSQVKSYLDNGQLVPDQLVVDVVAERLRQEDCAEGCLLDGFPRTIAQAEALALFFQQQNKQLTGTLQLTADKDEIKRRLVERADKENRPDDTPETISERLQVYEQQTSPLVEFYEQRNTLHRVDGMGTPDEVFDRIRGVLDLL